MKNLFGILCTLLVFTNQILAQTAEKTVKTHVQRVTVFQQGAQLASTEMVSIGAGTTNIIFEGVSPYLQANSLQASGKGDLIVMDVQHKVKFAEQTKMDLKSDDPQKQAYINQFKMVADSLVELDFKQRTVNTILSNLNQERSFLVGNRMIQGNFTKDSLALFTQSLDFFKARVHAVDMERLKYEREVYYNDILRGQLNTRHATLQTLISGNFVAPTTGAKPVPQVIVTVMSERAMVAEVTLMYYVNQAGWAASYDLRASKENSNIELKHRAAVYQNTGIDWKDVSITLSTGNPNQQSVKPILSPQFLTFEVPLPTGDPSGKNKPSAYKLEAPKMPEVQQNSGFNNSNFYTAGSSVTTIAMPSESMADMEEKEGDGVTNFTQVSQNMLRVEYEIKLKYTIESDNKAHNVIIQSKTIPAAYSYSVVPKLDPDAFLMARVTDWEEMNLIPGSARVYFDNSYIGESFINPRSTNDTLQLNLGRDKGIVVTRSKVKDKCKDKSLSDNHVLTRVYEITVRNTKNIPIRLIVEDQMPVAKDPEIKIEYLEEGGAKFNSETGKMVWDINVKPKDNKRLTFSYEVKTPKTKNLLNL